MRRFLAAVVATATLLLVPAASAGAADKVSVCHAPPDNPGAVHLIQVARSALADHLAHGDALAFDGSCYVMVSPDMATPAAEQVCVERYGGHLASIHSEAQNEFIGSLVDPAGAGDRSARVGGVGTFCQGPNATYAWTDGSPWDFDDWRPPHQNNWYIQEPSCSAGGNPAALQLVPHSSPVWLRGWNDVWMNHVTNGFVCRFDPVR